MQVTQHTVLLQQVCFAILPTILRTLERVLDTFEKHFPLNGHTLSGFPILLHFRL